MTGKWFEIKCISVFTWFQPSNVRDNFLITTVDTKSNFWLKTNTIFFLCEFDLSLFSLQYNHVISIFKISRGHTECCAVILNLWNVMQGDHVICYKILHTVGFAQVRRQNKIHIAEIQLFFPNFSVNTTKVENFYILTMDTGVEISFFSVYCKLKGSRLQRNFVKPGKKTFFFMQLARCVNIW